MIIRHFFTPGLAINSYMIFDEETKRAAVIDPTRNINAYIERARTDGVEITDILETHVHADFLSGAKALKIALPNKPTIHCSGLGGKEWTPQYTDHVVKDKDQLQLGHVRLQAIHTPGHTPEHLIWLIFDEQRSLNTPCGVFTGDLLFVGSVGRPDLLGNANTEDLSKQLYKSLFSTLHALPEFLEVLPAHGAGSPCGKQICSRDSSTIGYEKRCNPWLTPRQFKEWQQLLLKDIVVIPPYFPRMKRVNVEGLDETRKQTSPPALTPAQCTQNAIIIDIRNPELFAANHISGSINIPLGPQFPLWMGIVLPETKPFVLVAASSSDISVAMQSLRLLGLDDVAGVFCTNNAPWSFDKAITTSLPLIDVESLHKEIEKYYILDVRTPAEWQSGHIEGSHHLELPLLPQSLKNLPHDKPIAVLCRSGSRASLAASLLSKTKDFTPFNVRGGIQAWIKAKLPIVS